MKRVAIIGGGISGLSAAWHLDKARRQGAQVEFTLFESAAQVGGVMLTDQLDGCLIEAGPDSFLSVKTAAAELCRELGIGGDLIGSNDAERKTYIYVDGKLIAMPDGLMMMIPTKPLPTLLSPLFSLDTKIRMVEEYFYRPRPRAEDESAAAFVERHFGREMAERLADPLLAGVYGGSARKLSARAVLAAFVDMEARYGSLSRATLAMRRARKTHAAPGPLFSSLKNGMQQMVDALIEKLPRPNLRTNSPAKRVTRISERWQLDAGKGADDFDAVIFATPAYVAAHLLHDASPKLAAQLAGINYSSSVTVAVGYDAADLERLGVKLPEGFGFLVPSGQGVRMLACTFVHKKFPHRAPEGRYLLRIFLGGDADPGVLDLSDAEVLALVSGELKRILGLAAEPRFSRIYRWRRAMAQYEIGHLDRVAAIERLRRELPGLAIAGNALKGIGVPDCVRSGKEAAEELLLLK